MRKRVKQLVSRLTTPQEAMLLPAVALRSVTSKNQNGVYASSDTLYKGAIFGRDSLEVAEDLIAIKPRLVRNILLTLARLQGTVYNTQNEEEPGKIIHEYRSTVVDGKPIDGTTLDIFKQLSSKWGGNDKELVYYGSVDSTPQFLRTLGMYCKAHGESILDKPLQQKDGTLTTMREVAGSCAEWVLKKHQTSRSGLIEYKRQNPRGILNQVWKDSEEFYVHENKERVNHDAPVASIEVQGLAYDGLMAAAYFIADRAEIYQSAARTLRDKTLELLWQADVQRFALGLDYDKKGNMRIIRTPTVNPAALLDTRFFDDVRPQDRQKYVSSIIEHVMGNDFLTDAGIRSRALSASSLITFWDYHGSCVSWPKETYDIAKGMRRQGFRQLARQLENRVLNVILKNRHYPEFVYIDEQGRVLTSRLNAQTQGDLIYVDSTIKPERIQAWTVSAVMAIVYKRFVSKVKRKQRTEQAAWQATLEKQILTSIHKVEVYVNPFALSARYPTYPYRLVDPNGQ